jgi:exodeoxyribonuclease V beta subunit
LSTKGRYWVLDYKSNALGPKDADYTIARHGAGHARAPLRRAGRAVLAGPAPAAEVRLGAAYRPAQHLGGAHLPLPARRAGPAAGCCLLPAVPALLQALDAMLPTPPEPLR